MPDRIELSLLIDYYGAFLTENQRELLELSCDEDLSLSEIASLKGISRQGVRDALARGTKALLEMNDKLNLIERDRSMAECIAGLESGLASAEALVSAHQDSGAPEPRQQLLEELENLRALVGRLAGMMG